MQANYAFVGEYTNSHQLTNQSSTARQIKDYMAGAAFSLSKSFMSLGITTNSAGSSKQR